MAEGAPSGDEFSDGEIRGKFTMTFRGDRIELGPETGKPIAQGSDILGSTKIRSTRGVTLADMILLNQGVHSLRSRSIRWPGLG